LDKLTARKKGEDEKAKETEQGVPSLIVEAVRSKPNDNPITVVCRQQRKKSNPSQAKSRR